jgi:hypothetical protein
MTARRLRPNTARDHTESKKGGSSLVRRLVGARDDPAKQRIRVWLSEIDDERLLNFGLSVEDIALLRGPRNGELHQLPGGRAKPRMSRRHRSPNP